MSTILKSLTPVSLSGPSFFECNLMLPFPWLDWTDSNQEAKSSWTKMLLVIRPSSYVSKVLLPTITYYYLFIEYNLIFPSPWLNGQQPRSKKIVLIWSSSYVSKAILPFVVKRKENWKAPSFLTFSLNRELRWSWWCILFWTADIVPNSLWVFSNFFLGQ